ncbi:malic enzyme [Gracilaria domingensis]|nr:malic enzyme [Gracilaria domingensis]
MSHRAHARRSRRHARARCPGVAATMAPPRRALCRARVPLRPLRRDDHDVAEEALRHPRPVAQQRHRLLQLRARAPAAARARPPAPAAASLSGQARHADLPHAALEHGQVPVSFAAHGSQHRAVLPLPA